MFIWTRNNLYEPDHVQKEKRENAYGYESFEQVEHKCKGGEKKSILH